MSEHAREASRDLSESSLLNEWSEPERLILATRAVAEATLALAYEQRTANLIALWGMGDDACMSLDKSNGMNVDEWKSVAMQIRERLGLA